MSVYKKLQKARVMLHESQLNKSGKNKFANFNYFELGDFIPQVTSIFDKVGLCGIVMLCWPLPYDASTRAAAVLSKTPTIGFMITDHWFYNHRPLVYNHRPLVL
jgi:hypothetical protein